mgnify:CR=1 FL=1
MLIHVVKPGETLWQIANRYRVSTASIAEVNGLDCFLSEKVEGYSRTYMQKLIEEGNTEPGFKAGCKDIRTLFIPETYVYSDTCGKT